jgi:hypothetical protein
MRFWESFLCAASRENKLKFFILSTTYFPIENKFQCALNRVILYIYLPLLAGCANTLQSPSADFERFQPIANKSRVLDAPIVNLVIKPNAHEVCSKIIGMEPSGLQRVMACAYWDIRKNECTIVTHKHTATNIIGHELRHCFEGFFHP